MDKDQKPVLNFEPTRQSSIRELISFLKQLREGIEGVGKELYNKSKDVQVLNFTAQVSVTARAQEHKIRTLLDLLKDQTEITISELEKELKSPTNPFFRVTRPQAAPHRTSLTVREPKVKAPVADMRKPGRKATRKSQKQQDEE